MKTKALFIVNPVSGVGKQKKIETLIKENLDHDLYDYTVRYTEHIHHGTDIAREGADAGFGLVVAVGGDGSVNDVAQGLVGSPVTMGIIPCGSGNGLARGLKIPLKPAGAIRALNAGQEQAVDAILINDRRVSVNAAGVGFDAYIARLMKAAKTRGFAAYTNLILREYAPYKCNDYRLTIDGRTIERNAWFIAIANGSQFGYNLSVAPKAKLNDGFLDITILDKIPLDHVAITAPLAFMRLLDHSQHAEMFRAKEVHLEGNVHKWVNIDGEGENLGNELHFKLLPSAYKIMVKSEK